MNIALIGYGRMNKTIERIAIEKGHMIIQTMTSTQEIASADLSTVDIAMEFSVPDAGPDNMIALLEQGVSTVSGTTGCQREIPRVLDVAKQSDCAFLWSPNFSIGVNIFWQIIAETVQRMNAFPDYDIFGHEYHHARKEDSPSGTARKTAEIILEHSIQKKELITQRLDRSPTRQELHFSSTRGGSVPGTHLVAFDSPNDTLEIRHTARGSEAFALGAVLTAEWLQGKRGVFEMQDFLSDSYPSSL